MATIADRAEDEEERATAFDTLTRHLRTDLMTLREGFREAARRYDLVKRKAPTKKDTVVPFPVAASNGAGGDAA